MGNDKSSKEDRNDAYADGYCKGSGHCKYESKVNQKDRKEGEKRCYNIGYDHGSNKYPKDIDDHIVEAFEIATNKCTQERDSKKNNEKNLNKNNEKNLNKNNEKNWNKNNEKNWNKNNERFSNKNDVIQFYKSM